jgi:hypothetical protein
LVGQNPSSLLQHETLFDVRVGSLADIAPSLTLGPLHPSKRTFASLLCKSAVGQLRIRAVQQNHPSLDHLVGTDKQRSWHGALMMCSPSTTSTSSIGRPIQPPMLLWPKPLDLRLERGFDRPVGRLNGDHARPGVADTASLADALDLRTLLRELASAQD